MANIEHHSLYIDLLIKCVAGTIYGDPGISPSRPSLISKVKGFLRSVGKKAEYDPVVRENGADWPTIAHTMIGVKRLSSLRDCVETVIKDNVPGDFIETGVWRGGACILMRGILKAYGVENRTVYVADSFAGLPPPDPTYPADTGDRHHMIKELAISLEDVRNAFQAYELLDSQVKFVKGWFKDTLPKLDVQRFAVIRLDGDMYGSTMEALESLYPRVSPKGFVIIDDYGAVPGCQRAVDDYRSLHNIEAPMHEIDWSGRFWRKTA